eukprot:6205769-Pleurochrysis_carterae.AAC.4
MGFQDVWLAVCKRRRKLRGVPDQFLVGSSALRPPHREARRASKMALPTRRAQGRAALPSARAAPSAATAATRRTPTQDYAPMLARPRSKPRSAARCAAAAARVPPKRRGKDQPAAAGTDLAGACSGGMPRRRMAANPARAVDRRR